MKYLVLAKKDNETLTYYLDKYYLLLLEKLSELSDVGFLNEKITKLLKVEESDGDYSKKNFILYPDNSALINYFYDKVVKNYNGGFLNEPVYKKNLEEEIELFLNGKSHDGIMAQGEIIEGTSIRLTTIQNNIYSQNEAHPDHRKTGGIEGWGMKTKQEWLDIYAKTFSLLEKIDSGYHDEINRMVQKIIPLGTAESLHNSASYKECIGHIYMGYTIDSHCPELNNLEAVIHESSHNKLNIVYQFDPLYTDSMEEKYYSPYRPDARHIQGVFLGIHAFVPVIYVLMKAASEKIIDIDDNWKEKLLLYYMKNKVSLKVLQKYAHFTQVGQSVMDEVVEVMKLTDSFVRPIGYTAEIIKRCRDKQVEHFGQVNKNYPRLEY